MYKKTYTLWVEPDRHFPDGPERDAAMDLSDPQQFSAAYDRHHRAVYATAYRICGNAAQAQGIQACG